MFEWHQHVTLNLRPRWPYLCMDFFLSTNPCCCFFSACIIFFLLKELWVYSVVQMTSDNKVQSFVADNKTLKSFCVIYSRVCTKTSIESHRNQSHNKLKTTSFQGNHLLPSLTRYMYLCRWHRVTHQHSELQIFYVWIPNGWHFFLWGFFFSRIFLDL